MSGAVLASVACNAGLVPAALRTRWVFPMRAFSGVSRTAPSGLWGDRTGPCSRAVDTRLGRSMWKFSHCSRFHFLENSQASSLISADAIRCLANPPLLGSSRWMQFAHDGHT
jgi:hypothetical protein